MLKVQLEFMLLVGCKFGLLLGHVEDVGSGSALRVDQAHFNVASQFGKRGTDVIQESRAIQRYNLDHGTVGRAIVIEMDSGIDTDLWRMLFRLKFLFHQIAHIEFAGNSGDKILFQTGGLGGIVVEGTKPVGKAQDVQHGSGLIGVRVRL